MIERDEDLLDMLHARLICDLDGQLTPGNEGVGDEQDQEEYEACDDAEALVNELHGDFRGQPRCAALLDYSVRSGWTRTARRRRLRQPPAR